MAHEGPANAPQRSGGRGLQAAAGTSTFSMAVHLDDSVYAADDATLTLDISQVKAAVGALVQSTLGASGDEVQNSISCTYMLRPKELGVTCEGQVPSTDDASALLAALPAKAAGVIRQAQVC